VRAHAAIAFSTRVWNALVHRLDRRRVRRRLLSPPTVTREAITHALRSLGVRGGDGLMFHASLSAFGEVEGGAEAVVDALLDAVGPEGTVLAPSFSRFELRKGEFGSWWDPQTTPVYTGSVTEAFWRRPGALRSGHPTHAVAAIGPRAAFYTSEHGVEGDRPSFWGTGTFDSRSPWEKMTRADVHYLMVGCTFEPATLGHYVESCLVADDLEGLPDRERDGFARALRHNYYHPDGPWPDIDRVKLGAVLAERGLVKSARVGWGAIERIGAADYFREAVSICRADPARWLPAPYLAWRERVGRRKEEL